MVMASLLVATNQWIVPQPKANVWKTLAKALGQDHICLSSMAAGDPRSTCLVGIPFRREEFSPVLLKLKDHYNNKAPGRVALYIETRTGCDPAYPVISPLVLWQDWLLELWR